MPIIRILIKAEELEAKRISQILERAFEDDAYPTAIFETKPDGKEWAAEILIGDMSAEDARELVRDRVGADAFAAPIEAEELPEINWVEKSLEGLKPVRAGRFFVHGSHDRDRRPFNAHSIEVEAALAFGTGHHGTTAGCLIELDRLLNRQSYGRILDLGTGTGVLAIAIAMMTKQEVIATDIDPVAVKTTRENAQKNGVGQLVKAFAANGVDDRRFGEEGPFDLVVANILAKPLTKLAYPLSRRMAWPATIVLSGLREQDGPRIVSAYATQGFKLVRKRSLDGWLTLTLVRGRQDA